MIYGLRMMNLKAGLPIRIATQIGLAQFVVCFLKFVVLIFRAKNIGNFLTNLTPRY